MLTVLSKFYSILYNDFVLLLRRKLLLKWMQAKKKDRNRNFWAKVMSLWMYEGLISDLTYYPLHHLNDENMLCILYYNSFADFLNRNQSKVDMQGEHIFAIKPNWTFHLFTLSLGVESEIETSFEEITFPWVNK